MEARKSCRSDAWSDFEVRRSAGGREWALEWEWIGEGNQGDYDPEDPEDVPRLRATLKVDGKRVTDGSYCTLASTTTPRKELEESAAKFLEDISSATVESGPYEDEVRVCGLKHNMEAWTWKEYTT